MYDFYYETLLGDSSKFNAADNIQNTIIEVSNSGEVSMLGTRRLYNAKSMERSELTDWYQDGLPRQHLNHELVDETHLLQWLRYSCQNGASHRLQIIMGRPEEHNSDAEILPLPMSSGTFEEIQSTWRFPSELLRMMLSTMPLATEFETENHIGTRHLAYERRSIWSEAS